MDRYHYPIPLPWKNQHTVLGTIPLPWQKKDPERSRQPTPDIAYNESMFRTGYGPIPMPWKNDNRAKGQVYFTYQREVTVSRHLTYAQMFRN